MDFCPYFNLDLNEYSGLLYLKGALSLRMDIINCFKLSIAMTYGDQFVSYQLIRITVTGGNKVSSSIE